MKLLVINTIAALLSIISHHLASLVQDSVYDPSACFDLKTVVDNSFIDFGNMPLSHSREFLLLAGKEVLTSAATHRINAAAYSQIKQCGLSTVKKTRRGKRSGRHFKPKPATPPQHLSDELIIAHCNARSILNKWDEIVDHIIDNSIDILMVTETWISPNKTNDPQLKHLPAGYAMLQVPRPHRRGGGVALIYRECLHINSYEPTTAKCFEGLEVVMTINSHCLRLLVLYRPPPSPQNGFKVSQFITEFSDYMEKTLASSGRLLIGGDFNFHWDNPQHPDTIQIRDALDSVNLQQHVTGATHTSGHTLDWFLSNETEDIVKKTEISSLLSDHHFVHCTVNMSKPPLPREVRTYRSYKSLDESKLKQQIENSDLILNPKTDLDGLVDQYNDTLSALIDEHAPLKTGTITIRPVTPWYNEMIHAAKVVRRKCEAIWRRSRLTIHRELYATARNKVSTLIRQAKTTFYTDRVEECKDDQKALFSVVDEILGRKKQQSLPPHDSLKDVLDRFSVFFHTKISNIRAQLDSEVLDPPTSNLPSVLPIEDRQPEGSLETFRILTVDNVKKLVTKSPTKSCGLDPLPTWLLKKFVEPLLPTITHIINTSLQSGVFPPALKHARVTPLLKKPQLDKSICKNYRPVSNLAFLSKLLERAALSQLTDHMEEHNLFCPLQSAYRSKHSTETALLKIQSDILLHLDAGKGVILVLLDLSAAFDTIDHEILVSRLQSRIGVKGHALEWFHSYLEDRYQVVHIQGESSDSVQLIFGVPQGSVLGPFEFLVYMCPIYDIARKHGISIHQYADDTQLYLAFDLEHQEEAMARMEACVNDIRRWMLENKLKLNDDKSELVVIAPARHAHKVSIDRIKIGDCYVHSSKSAKNLGATFDDTMCMHQHVTTLVRSCNAQLRSIGQARKYLTKDATEKVLHAFLTSRLDCGNSLLYGLPDFLIQKLQRVQNTAARILTRTRKSEHISPILRSLHWLPVSKRIDYKIMILTYKCLHNLAPSYLQDLIHPYQPSRSLRSSSQVLLQIPKTRLKTYGDRSFAKAAPTLWNSLPLDIRESDSLDIFKRALKTHLFSQG